jgi:hypothetical protein
VCAGELAPGLVQAVRVRLRPGRLGRLV